MTVSDRKDFFRTGNSPARALWICQIRDAGGKAIFSFYRLPLAWAADRPKKAPFLPPIPDFPSLDWPSLAEALSHMGTERPILTWGMRFFTNREGGYKFSHATSNGENW